MRRSEVDEYRFVEEIEKLKRSLEEREMRLKLIESKISSKYERELEERERVFSSQFSNQKENF